MKLKIVEYDLKKYVLTALFITIGLLGVFATPQILDKLIYKGDTLRVRINLPDEFWETETLIFDSVEYVNRYISAVKLFGDKKLCNTSSCYAYYAAWEIIENQLYLTDIYSCCYYEDSIKADLVSLFKEKVIDAKVKADWVTGIFISWQGKRLLYDHDMATGGIFEYELELNFEKGKLTGTQLYDNRKSRQSVYSQDDKKLQEHIYSNINWKILPKQDTIVEVCVLFTANENGLVEDVQILSDYNEIYDNEMVRVMKTIPEWDVYLCGGKNIAPRRMITITFSEKYREKYEK